ncbi:nitroreductase family protein [Elusimicrobiota bacterium]
MQLWDALLGKNAVLQTIKKRRSTRVFLDKQVPDEDIDALLQAANQAPSAHNQQSWRFIVIKGKKKSELVNLITDKAAQLPKTSSVLLRMASRSIQEAPVVIAISNSGELMKRGGERFKLNKNISHDFFRTMEIQSSAAAVQNLLLAATSLDIGAVWLGILFLIKDDVLEFLEEPKGEFMAVVPVGYASKEMKGPKKRGLEAVVKRFED